MGDLLSSQIQDKKLRSVSPPSQSPRHAHASEDTEIGLPATRPNIDRLAAVPSLPTNSDIHTVGRVKEADLGNYGRFSASTHSGHNRESIKRNTSCVGTQQRTLTELSLSEISNETNGFANGVLEGSRSQEDDLQRIDEHGRAPSPTMRGGAASKLENKHIQLSPIATHLYVVSYLIFFSFLGTLARLGLQAITFYPGAPVAFSVLWANFSGCLIMGFLVEDRMLFKEEWGTPVYHQRIENARQRDEEIDLSAISLQAAKKEHSLTKKTIPLYIGLATGFCGCFTSFSSFIRDVFLALSNYLPTPLNHPADYVAPISSITSTVSRSGGYSFMALVSIIITTTCLCISGHHLGTHIAIACEPHIPCLSFKVCRKYVDRAVVLMGWGCWLGAIFLAVFPPDRYEGNSDTWRGQAVFALVFAPLGCLGRYYISLYLNRKLASFPIGTFVINTLGTAVLGMSYDLQRIPSSSVIGCQVLQGIEDGFCGCLTTVSTWVNELVTLRRVNAYIYGGASIVVSLGSLIVIIGSLQWTEGFSAVRCVH